MTLNDSEVQKQIRHMMAFIDQEASEKVEEIDAKAEEEFQIEKSRLVQNQRLKIMEYYSKKEKQIELAKKIQDSNLKNKSRLQVLQSREQHIQILLKEAAERLGNLITNKEQYSKTLLGLITQCFYQILEPEVLVRCRMNDVDLVKCVLPKACEVAQQATGQRIQARIDTTYLPENISGGVECMTLDGKIRVVNTLESRLSQIAEQMMPDVREILFGINPNRKFRN